MNKYYAQKTELYGILFDSKAESARWSELKLLEKAGLISNLRRQITYELIPKQKNERATNYIADFVYGENGKTVVEDTKGMKTPAYIIKRKLMLWIHGIEVKEC